MRKLCLSITLLALQISLTHAQTTATTDQFRETNSIPVSGRTTFNEPIWTSGDAVRTSEHELLHAAGFTVAYSQFDEHVDANRKFRRSRPSSGTVLAKLTSANVGTHVDPQAGSVNGHDQSKSVMGPSRVTGQRMGPQEKSVLNAAFWSSRKLKVTVDFQGTWPAAKKAHINSAVSAAESLFSNGAQTHTFTWKVRINTTKKAMPMNPKFDELMANLKAPELATRQRATVEIFGLRKEIAIASLQESGARLMKSLNPPIENVVLSVFSRDAELPYKTDSFAIHTAKGTTLDELRAIGERTGFVMAEVNEESNGQSVIYVEILQGHDLWFVIREVIQEPQITNINLNFFEED